MKKKNIVKAGYIDLHDEEIDIWAYARKYPKEEGYLFKPEPSYDGFYEIIIIKTIDETDREYEKRLKKEWGAWSKKEMRRLEKEIVNNVLVQKETEQLRAKLLELGQGCPSFEKLKEWDDDK